MVHHELVTGAEITLRPGTIEFRLQVPRELVDGTRLEVRDVDGAEVRGLVRHRDLVVAHAGLAESVRVLAVNSAGFPSGSEVTISLRVEAPGRPSDEVVAERLQLGGQREALLLDVAEVSGGLVVRLPRADAALGSIADHARGVARSSGLALPTARRVVVDASASMSVLARGGRLASALALVQGVLAASDQEIAWALAGAEVSPLPQGSAVDLPERVAAAVTSTTVVGSATLETTLVGGGISWIVTDLPPAGWSPGAGTVVLTLVDTFDLRAGVHFLPPADPGPHGAEQRRASVLALLSDDSFAGELR